MDLERLSELIVSAVVLPQAEPLSQPTLHDKIKGVIFGNALGDALGVRTEFLSSSFAKSTWLDTEFTLKNWPNWRRFPEGDWTDDTDQMILILINYLESSAISPLVFAQKLKFWSNHGFPELGDTIGLGIGYTVMKTISHAEFLTNPFFAALQVWVSNRCDLAANGALMRTSILGVINYRDIRKVIKQTIEVANVTHVDPRCVTSCVVYTVSIALMLQGVEVNVALETSRQIARVCIMEYTNMLEVAVDEMFGKDALATFIENKKNFSVELMEGFLEPEFSGLLPLDREDLGYTYKCLGCAFWAVRQEIWIEAIKQIILEGGDADTNGAAAGAIIGCKVGFGGLPKNLINEIRHKAWLDEMIERLINIIN